MSTSRTSLLTLGTITGVLALAVACSPGPREQYRARLQDTGKPALHAVHSDRLRTIMQEINRLTYDRLPQEYDTTGKKERLAREAGDVARALQASADDVLGVMPQLDLSAGDAETFRRLAEKLHAQGTMLEEQGRLGQVEKLPETLEAMKGTCVACHSLFRGEAPLFTQRWGS